jgi:hypothetical protein
VSTSFVDNPEKCVVRAKWNTPLLRHLNTAFGVRYRYFGLPGVNLIDVNLWRDMIDDVVAFEPPSKVGDPRAAIDSLRRNMRVRGIPGRAYWGSFEEVVILGSDYEGTKYSQDKVVTLYNLDFCDEISSRVQTREKGKQTWRFEAIRHVLRDQIECFQREGKPRHFILMITIRNQINANKIKSFLSPTSLQGDTQAFHQQCSEKDAIPGGAQPLIGTHTWALKTLLFNMLCNYLGNPHISALFFPQVMYQGTRKRVTDESGKVTYIPSPMLHWLVLCRFCDIDLPTPDFCPPRFLWYPSLRVESSQDRLSWRQQTGEEPDGKRKPCPVEWFNEFGELVSAGLKS